MTSQLWQHTISDMRYRGTIRIPKESVLIAFESAARHGSFSRAARELRISRSAVRSRVGGLEKQLSIRLFDRSRSGLNLTEAGRRFLDAVDAGLRVIQAGVAEAANYADGRRTVMGLSEDADPRTPVSGESRDRKTQRTS